VRARRWGWELLFALAVAYTCLPLWAAAYLPVQDLPQHLAAIRVLHSFDDPAFGFARYFELQLFRTQYLAYYLAAHLLSYALDLELANRVLVTACLAGTPYALRSLLRALGRDERYALFALPLAYNAHFILGFVNFLMAIALALWGLALAVRERDAPKLARAALLALVALTCFYSHVVPFALFALGAGLIAIDRDVSRTARRLLPLAPSALASAVWIFGSPAGRATVSAASGGAQGPKATFVPLELALRDLPNWLTDILHGDLDRQLLRWFGLVFLLALFAGLLPQHAAAPRHRVVARLGILPLAAAVLYFVAPTGHDWIWPIAQRFPLLAILFAIPVLPRVSPALGGAVAAALLLVTALQVREVSRAFDGFQAEVADFDAALERIPPGRRVLGLIYERGSRQVKFSPFIQYVAYYQARKGGAVMFTFADFPQSPFRFREDERPPRVQPRWEWMPQRVRYDALGWYDYVIVRGRAVSPCSHPRQGCKAVYRGEAWEVWATR
jgi:hypothetical protein